MRHSHEIPRHLVYWNIEDKILRLRGTQKFEHFGPHVDLFTGVAAALQCMRLEIGFTCHLLMILVASFCAWG